VFVRVTTVKSKDRTKYVELVVEDFWTRVRFPPPPPIFREKIPQIQHIAGFFMFQPIIEPCIAHEVAEIALAEGETPDRLNNASMLSHVPIRLVRALGAHAANRSCAASKMRHSGGNHPHFRVCLMSFRH
jgi:hypothetical protein